MRPEQKIEIPLERMTTRISQKIRPIRTWNNISCITSLLILVSYQVQKNGWWLEIICHRIYPTNIYEDLNHRCNFINKVHLHSKWLYFLPFKSHLLTSVSCPLSCLLVRWSCWNWWGSPGLHRVLFTVCTTRICSILISSNFRSSCCSAAHKWGKDDISVAPRPRPPAPTPQPPAGSHTKIPMQDVPTGKQNCRPRG